MMIAEDLRSSAAHELIVQPKPRSRHASNSSLEGYLRRLREHIRVEGLQTLLWATGTYTREIGAALLNAASEPAVHRGAAAKASNKCCIITRSDEDHLEGLVESIGADTRQLLESDCDDSFLILNESVVLDITPMMQDNGRPELSEDPIVVELYSGLFAMLSNRSVPRHKLRLVS